MLTVEARSSCGQQVIRKDLHTLGSSNLILSLPLFWGPTTDQHQDRNSSKLFL